MRKGFNFYRSYFEVSMELKDDEFIDFIKAILQKQFNGIEPTNLKGMAKFAYLSQKHSIDSQVKGYEDKTKSKLEPMQGGSEGGAIGGSVQEQEKEKEKEKVQISSILKFDLENCIKIFLEKTENNWNIGYAKKEAEKFYNFYSMKNWMVGKNKMKSLPHAIAGWISRNENPILIKTSKTKEEENAEKLRYFKEQGF
jgi:hypothetical protein